MDMQNSVPCQFRSVSSPSVARSPGSLSTLAYDCNNNSLYRRYCCQRLFGHQKTEHSLLMIPQSTVIINKAAATVIGTEICKFATYQACVKICPSPGGGAKISE